MFEILVNNAAFSDGLSQQKYIPSKEWEYIFAVDTHPMLICAKQPSRLWNREAQLSTQYL